MSFVKVLSAIQYRPDFSRSKAEVINNIKNCIPYIKRAVLDRSRFIVLPELCFSGYSFLNPEEACLVGEPYDGVTYELIKKVAVKYEVYIAYGYVEMERSGSLYNSCNLVDPKGTILASYRKINLWGNDFLWATSGKERPEIINTELGKVSIVVCRDLRDKIPSNIPNNLSDMKKSTPFFDGEKVDIVAACTNWGKGSGFPSTTWMDFASNNQCTLVVSNRWGEEVNGSLKQDFGQGGSCIIEKNWKVHTHGLTFGSNCVVSSVIY